MFLFSGFSVALLDKGSQVCTYSHTHAEQTHTMRAHAHIWWALFIYLIKIVSKYYGDLKFQPSSDSGRRIRSLRFPSSIISSSVLACALWGSIPNKKIQTNNNRQSYCCLWMPVKQDSLFPSFSTCPQR